MSQANIIIPVVYLPNVYQSQHLVVEVPQSDEADRKRGSDAEALSPEDEELLQKFHLQSVDPLSDSDECAVPAFCNQRQIRDALNALEIEDDNERLFRLYAVFQTSPQLFGALNEHLPAEKQLELENEFQNVKEVDIPVRPKVADPAADTSVKKFV